jgi:two-component system response regulator (stage 0 sporulation protein A)
MKNLSSVSIIMAELTSIKNLLTKQNEFLQTLGCESLEEMAPAAEFTYIETEPVKPIQNLDYKLSAFLKELGIPARYSGYSYLREGIKLLIQDSNMQKITKTLYPELAKMYNVSYAGVERSIRYAIEVSWDKNRNHPFYQFYDSRPTNLAFIADVVDKLRFEGCVELAKVSQI